VNSKNNSCKYCHKAFEEVECPEMDNYSFLDIFSGIIHISVYLVFLVLSLVIKSVNKKKFKRKKTILTCNNQDCINYLKGCFHGSGMYS
jgi:hypothetical protein